MTTRLNPLSAGKSFQTTVLNQLHSNVGLNPLFYAFFETVFLRKAQEVCSDPNNHYVRDRFNKS